MKASVRFAHQVATLASEIIAQCPNDLRDPNVAEIIIRAPVQAGVPASELHTALTRLYDTR
jgi:hypothetical protein